MSIIGDIRSYLWVRKQKKIDPLKYSLILNEKGMEYSEIYGLNPIDDGIYFEPFITDAGIQSCGLYFKVKRFGKVDGEYDIESKVLDMCRISMERPEYITGFDETFKLTNSQISKMIEIFNSTEYGIRIWDHMFYVLNNVRDFNPEFKKIEVLPMPDYTLLKCGGMKNVI